MKYDDGGGGEVTKYEKMRCFKCGSVNILFSYATGYECKDCGAKSGDPEGFVYDFIFPVKEDQQATIAQLTAELAEARADAERLAKTFVIEVYPHEWVCRSGCHHMGKSPATINHAPDCPITLHRELVAKYGQVVDK
jgi:DNA-directed RNA polymerase subunit RPC12/RpoP